MFSRSSFFKSHVQNNNNKSLCRSALLNTQDFEIIIILYKEHSIIKNFYHILSIQNEAVFIAENPRTIHLMNKETESQEGKVIIPRPHNKEQRLN